MFFPRFAHFAIFGAAFLATSPAVAQYQELPVEADNDYSWLVQVNDGEVVLAGDVPYLSVKELLIDRAGGEAIDRMGIAEGAPRGFMIDAITAIEASALLSEGSVRYTDGGWVVSGTLLAGADRGAFDEVLGERTAAGDRWSVELDEGTDQDATETANADAGEPRETDASALGQDSADRIAAARSGEALGAEAEMPQLEETVQEAPGRTIGDAIPEAADEGSPGLTGDQAEAEERDAEAENDQAPSADIVAAPGGEADPEQEIAEFDSAQAAQTESVAAEPNSISAVDPNYAFAVEITGGELVFSGQVPDAATRLMAGNMASGLDGLADLTVAEGAPDDFTKTAFAGIAALEYLEAGSVSLADGQWRIEGEAAIDIDGRAALETLDRLSDADIWDMAITAPVAIDICRERVESYMTDRAILFGSGSARLTEDSEASLAGLSEIFAICPSAPVYVEGHTDADGGAEDNLILSLSRAEAVVDTLVDLGVDPGRLYAVGYGASLPIASNETAAGKAQNRRIVFSFEDAAGT